jgi:hypothetical protein
MPLSNIIVDPKLLKEVASSIHSFITRGEPLSWWFDRAALVQYGIAHFVHTGKEIKIEEPLALVGILQYFDSTSRTIEENIRTNFQLDRGLWFEEAVLLTVTRLLTKPAKLSNIFEFHGKIPKWAHFSARIVTQHAYDGPLPFSIDHPFDPTSIVAYSAKDPEDVEHWLKNGEEGWCIPCKAMGPDLIARLELDNGRKLVLFIQAKCHSTGNIETVSAAVTAKAIRQLIPRNFFSPSLVCCWLVSSYIFIDFHCL